ncbi:hypothetical protein SKUN_001213 [Spiroplasma kunkelii CR2-3x]|uniref:Uncharacterized protein n=1 Tax=Spiroplasma kunkelii CR2-3x TaxID=273035 RepID=A0A0K2JI22_SPIKU|nr:hypothetical protein [Spiroplasma kunkelii]ALA98088.1 hypothetical protein SKUN_001213 [Spiroplasma kunkelii CR2-3x]
MKKLNKTCIKKRYWAYYFKCNQENKLNELMRKSYLVSQDEITDEHWALGKKN